MFGLIATTMVAVTGFLIARQMMAGDQKAAADADVAVYRDQLSEIDRDVERGLITAQEAETTRAEIGRRLIAAVDRQKSDPSSTPERSGRVGLFFVLIVLAALPAALYLGSDRLLVLAGFSPASVEELHEKTKFTVSLGEYDLPVSPVFGGLGNPELRDMPLGERDFASEKPTQEQYEARVAEENAAEEITPSPKDAELLRQLRQALSERPDDLTGYVLLARSEASLQRYGAAWRAQEKVVELRGEGAEAEDYTTLAELMIFAARGFISEPAETALDSALERDPSDRRARYYKGAALAQDGEPEQAMQMWTGLVAEGEADAQWKQTVWAQMRDLSRDTGVPLPPLAIPGPTSEDVQAAQDMTPEERQAMIRGMVNGLAERLASEGGTPDEWARLISALGVLGETDRARMIAEEAQVVFAENDDALAKISAALARVPQ